MKKRLTSLLLALVMILTLLPVQAFAVDPANPFRDVKQGDWCYDAVQYVRVNGFFNGTSRTTFSPNDTMTRGMFVTVLGRVVGVDTAQYQGESAFSDVPENAYFAPYVAWASKHGVTTGTGDGKFSPYAPINRQQMAAFFVRYFEAFGVDYSTDQNITTTPADMDSVSPYAREAVLKLWQRGLLNGDGVNFNPTSRATRAQAAMVCYRIDRAVKTWYKEPGVASDREKIDPSAPGGSDTKAPVRDPQTKPSTGGNSCGSGSGSTPGGNKPGGNTPGGNTPGGNTPGGDTPTPPSGDSYSVKFYDGSRLIETFSVKKGEPLGKVPSVAKSSKANYILEGYYTDSNFTTPFYAENPVNGDLSVYAKYESMGEAETLTLDSFARMDQGPDVSFRFKPLEETEDTLEAAKAAVTLAVKDGTDPVKIAVTDNGDGTYTVSAPDGFNPGCSYELNLAEGWTFLPDGSNMIPSDAIRTAAFSIEMAEVENLSMNSGIRYIQDTDEIKYTYTGQDNKTTTNAEILPSNADITKGGSFNYDGNTADWQTGDILCIYVGAQPDDKDENTKTEEAIYAKVSQIGSGRVEFEPLAEADQMRLYDIPDNFPITVGTLPTEATGTVSINGLDTATYALMVEAGENTVAEAKAKLNAGDFVTLYTSASAIESEADVYFGKVTKVEGDAITYTKTTAQAIEDSANLYKTVDPGELLTEEEKNQIERTVQYQVDRSDFAREAAEVLADMAVKTDGFRESAGLLYFAATGEDGETIPDQELRLYADAMELSDDDGDGKPDVEVKVKVETDKNKLHFQSKGVQLAVQVDAKFEVDGKDNGKIHFDLSATFVQEASVNPKVKGELVIKKILKCIPIPTGVQVNAIVDVKSYTAMSLRADIFTEGAEDKSLWEKFKEFTKDPSELANIPGLPDGVTDGLKTVGDVIDKIEDTKAKIDKGLEDANKLKSDLDTLWSVVEKAHETGLANMTREEYEAACEKLGKTNIAGELMDMLHLAQDDISAEYITSLDKLMDRYSELLEKETDWVQLVDATMFDLSTPPEFGVIVGFRGSFVVRADLNITLGTNLEYEVGKRYNFWFRVGLFKPTSGSSTMDLIDEHFAFQFYVMGKLGLKAGVRLKIYAAIGSVDAISVGITAEMGPYVKLWGFFIYDYSKYRPANSQNWVRKEQMAGALHLEFGLYLMVGVEAKALILEYDKDFLDKEYPLLTAGDTIYYYNTAYEPIDDEDVIVVGWDNATTQRPGCMVSTLLPDEIRALKYIDLTTGKQGEQILDCGSYIIQVSNPNFKVEVVDGRLVASVISVPQNVRSMDCDLTITYKYGKMAFSTFDMSATIHLTWSNLTSEERAQIYTASVTVPNGIGNMDTIWRKRIRKGTPFNLPTDDEIKKLLSWNTTKYAPGSGYGTQQLKDLMLIQDTQYNYNVNYQTYEITVTGIQPGNGSQTFTAKYGEKFNFSSLLDSGANSGSSFTRFAGLTFNGENLDVNKPVTGLFAQQVQSSRNAEAQAVYVDDSATATFVFSVPSWVTAPQEIPVTVRKGDTPSTASVQAPAGLIITGFYPEIGPIEGDTVYQVVCEAPEGAPANVTVTFDANGGSAVPSATRTVGAVLGALPDTTRTGYTFGGWYADAELTQSVNDGTVVNGPMTLYAKWTALEMTFTFNADGGVLPDGAGKTKSVTYDAAYGELPNPTKSDGATRYGFLGWYNENGERITAETLVSALADHTLTARWGELKQIPRSVFTPPAETKTLTYNGVDQTVDFTFTPEDGATYTEGSFKIDYIRQPDEILTQAVNRGEAATTGGTYNVVISREEDGTYAKFEEEYQNVLVIDRVNVDLSSITKADVEFSDRGYTWAQVRLKAGVLDELLKDLPATIDRSELYPIWQVEMRNSLTNVTQQYSYLEFSNKGSDSCLLYDLSTFYYNYIQSITLANSSDNTNFNVKKPEELKIRIPNAADGRFGVDLNDPYWSRAPWNGCTTGKYFAGGAEASKWYSEHKDEDTYYIGTAAEMTNFSLRVYLGESFAGKTIKLTADIDLSDLTYTTTHGDVFVYFWLPIGAELSNTNNGVNGLVDYNYSKYFEGTFDGDGHTIKGMLAKEGGLFFGLRGNGVIKNLNLENSFIHGEGGGIVICMEDNARIENCTSTATLRNLPSDKLYLRYFGKNIFQWTHTHTPEDLCAELPEIRKSPYVKEFSN